MDAVWLILDSISLSHTPFSEESSETMPQLAELAGSEALIFDEAYTPGPLTPSSHAAMVTGRLPSEVGMHEAHPYFDTDVKTIADVLAHTHTTHLISPNVWLFQGLDKRFDTATDLSRQYLIFRNATDPLFFDQQHDFNGSRLKKLVAYLREGEKPIRSLANMVNYRIRDGSLHPKDTGTDEAFQYARKINGEIRRKLSQSGDHFVLANYIDAHPPLNASDRAIEKFAPDVPKEELPIGVTPERHLQNEDKTYDVELMKKLYRAVLWDLDKNISSLIEDLLAEETFVVVTSDHGLWDNDTAYSENRLHIPLLLFVPGEPHRRISQTVNLNSLPSTTEGILLGGESSFQQQSLLKRFESHTSVTEIIHHPNDVYHETGRIDVTKSPSRDGSVQRDLVLINGDSKLRYINGEWEATQKGDEMDSLKSTGADILNSPIKETDRHQLKYENVTEERLRALGYKQ